jgi:hypothetical protein
MKQGGVEFKRRDQKEKRIILSVEIVPTVLAEIDKLFYEISTRVVEVPFGI